MSGIVGDNVGRSSGLTKAVTADVDFVKIATTTLGEDTQYVELQNCFSATYDRYLIIGDQLSSDDNELRGVMMTGTNTNNATEYQSIGSGTYVKWHSSAGTITASTYQDTDATYFRVSNGYAFGVSGNKMSSAQFWINNPFSDAKSTGGLTRAVGMAHDNSGEKWRWQFETGWVQNATTSHTGVEFYLSSDDIKSGASFTVYGLK